MAPQSLTQLELIQLQFIDPQTSSVVSLTPSDRKWMDDLINVVQESWNETSPSQPSHMQYKGSDDYLRARFEEYVFGFLSSAKFRAHAGLDASSASGPCEFGDEFLAQFCQTPVFCTWDSYTDETLYDLIPRQHPCTGRVTTVSDVALRLQAGLRDLNLEENLAPTREAIGAAIQAGSVGLSKVASSWRNDVARIASTSNWTSPRTDMSPRPSANESSEAPEVLRRDGALATLQATGAQGVAALSSIGSFLSAKQKAWTSGR